MPSEKRKEPDPSCIGFLIDPNTHTVIDVYDDSRYFDLHNIQVTACLDEDKKLVLTKTVVTHNQQQVIQEGMDAFEREEQERKHECDALHADLKEMLARAESGVEDVGADINITCAQIGQHKRRLQEMQQITSIDVHFISAATVNKIVLLPCMLVPFGWGCCVCHRGGPRRSQKPCIPAPTTVWTR
jgi:hypothetical protein